MIRFASFHIRQHIKDNCWITLCQMKRVNDSVITKSICSSYVKTQIRHSSLFHSRNNKRINSTVERPLYRHCLSLTVADKWLMYEFGVLPRREISTDTVKHFTSTEFLPVRLAYEYFITVHEWTGLPWWATVIFSTLLLRTTMTLPLFIVSQRNIARYTNVNYEMMEVTNILKAEIFKYSRENNLSQEEARALFSQQATMQMNKKIIEHNCHPMRAFLVVFLQVPVWISMSFGLRNLCGFSYANRGKNIYDGFTDGGILWFTDLTVSDPTFILPVLLGISNLLITEMTWLTMIDKIPADNFRMTYVQNILRFASISLVPIATMIPSIICLYWVSSSMYGVVQYLVIQQPRVRRALRIPKVETESETPIRDIIKNARKKYLKKDV